MHDTEERPRSRLASLDGFSPAADDAVQAEGKPSGGGAGPRFVFAAEEIAGLDELPDVAHEMRTLRRVLAVNKRLARCGTEAALVQEMLDASLALTGAERAFLLRGMDAQPGYEVAASRNAAGDPIPGPDQEVSPGIVTGILAGGSAVVVDDYPREAADVGDEPALGTGARSILAVRFPGASAQVLYLDSRTEPALFPAADRELVGAFAEQASLAVTRVRLAEDNLRQREELERAATRTEKLNRRLAELLARRTVELREAREDLALVDEQFRHRYTEIVGRGPATLELLRQVDRIADTEVPVLFEGDSGTGKELMARALHAGSRRASSRFVAENCAALPDTLLENELFGHERGAFTGADEAAMGLFERADGGTLFLDEVGDMSSNLQKRLLRVLQEGEVRRVGGSEVRSVDVRVVTATNRDLHAMVRAGDFREDLYYRLAVVKVRVPPLRERREDVPALVAHFLDRVRDMGPPRELTEEALDALVRYSWPGNIRQLENEVRRAVALSRGTIELSCLSREVREGRSHLPDLLVDPESRLEGRDLRSLVEELEIRVVRSALERERGNITHAARVLGLSRLGLRKKMQRYGLEKPTTR